jgi:hypothetical protein
MEMMSRIDCRGELSAVLIRADGTRQNFGTLANDDWSRGFRIFRRLWKSLRRNFGTVLASLLIAGMVHSGNLPPMALPMMGIVTTAGVNYMATDFASGGVTPTISGFKFHDTGIGATAAAVGDTAIQTAASPAPARVSGTPSNPSANQYKTVATVAYTGTNAITEWGLFSASSAGTLWDRRVFAAINVVSGDSIQFSYTLTVNNGGS